MPASRAKTIAADVKKKKKKRLAHAHRSRDRINLEKLIFSGRRRRGVGATGKELGGGAERRSERGGGGRLPLQSAASRDGRL